MRVHEICKPARKKGRWEYWAFGVTCNPLASRLTLARKTPLAERSRIGDSILKGSRGTGKIGDSQGVDPEGRDGEGGKEDDGKRDHVSKSTGNGGHGLKGTSKDGVVDGGWVDGCD